jgi:ComF family protein
VIRQAVHQLKYQNLRDISGMLAGFLAEYIETSPVPGDILVPVPLHPKRLNERGYNQSDLLARELGKLTGRKVLSNWLTKTRQTPPQARTSGLDERRNNVRGAFSCKEVNIRSTSIILIDDVSTSGSTLDAAAEALKSCGAVSVWGLTLAREI